MLFYGVSSAGVLAAELSRSTQTGESLPASIPRAELIRNLSVLVSYLEWVTSPGDGNYAACSEASKLLARILDEALDPQAAKNASSTSHSTLSLVQNELSSKSTENQTSPAINGNEAFTLDSEAFLDWFDSVDWNNTMGL